MATKQVFTNTIAQIAGKVATAGISIFLIKILTNYLGVDGYGLYSKIYTYLSIFAVIADLGLYTMSVREMTKYQSDPLRLRQISGTIMSLRAIFGVGIIVVSLLIALLLPGYNTGVALIGVGVVGIFTFFGLLNSSVLSILQAFLRTEFSFYSVTLGKIVGFLWVVLLAYILLPGPLTSDVLIASLSRADIALLGVFAAGLLGNIVMTAMLWVYTHRIAPVGFYWDPQYARSLVHSTLPYGLALFLGVIFFKVDVILLSLLEPLGLRSWEWGAILRSWNAEHILADRVVAIYSLPMKMIEVGMLFGTVFLNSMLPLFTSALAPRSKNSDMTSLVTKAYKILLFGGVGGAVYMGLEAENIIRLVASADFLTPVYGVNSADILRVVSSVFGLFFLSSLATYLLIASEHQGRLLRINLFIAITNLVGNALVIPYYGAMGSAVVTVVCQALLLIILARSTRDILAFDYAPRYTLGVVIFSVIAGYIVSVLPVFTNSVFVSLLISGTLFGIIYAWGVWGLEYTRRLTKSS